MRFYGSITKLDHQRRMVWGYASTEAQDSQGEIVKRAALEAALAEYMRFANIREMHQPSAVGVATEASLDDTGLYLGAKIVDEDAWQKVVEGVYKGFSIGGRVTARDTADRGVITGLSLTEISIVDRPANPEAVFDCWKAASGITPGLPRQIWDCGTAGHVHLTKAEATRCLDQRDSSGGDGDPLRSPLVAAPPRPREMPAPDAAAKGADISQLIQEAHDRLCAAGACCNGAHCNNTGVEAAANGVASGREQPVSEAVLAKAWSDDLTARLDALARRVEDIAQTPLPPVTMARHATGLAKYQDGLLAATDGEVIAALGRMSEEERTLTLIKATHLNPIRPLLR